MHEHTSVCTGSSMWTRVKVCWKYSIIVASPSLAGGTRNRKYLLLLYSFAVRIASGRLDKSCDQMRVGIYRSSCFTPIAVLAAGLHLYSYFLLYLVPARLYTTEKLVTFWCYDVSENGDSTVEYPTEPDSLNCCRILPLRSPTVLVTTGTGYTAAWKFFHR